MWPRLRQLLPISLPSLCVVCRSWGPHSVCTPCLNDLAPMGPRCPSCALPLAPGLTLCVQCTEDGHSPLHQACARVDYAWPWTDVVARWKFQQQPAWASEMARHLVQDPHTLALLHSASVWAPIPLAVPRLAERGYNQAWELVKHLHRHHPGAVTLPDALIRLDTQQLQHQLDRPARLVHAQDALCVNPAVQPQLTGQHVLLIDDVMTTGATLFAAAQHLRAAGAAKVSSVVYARTPLGTTRLRQPSPDDEAALMR